MYLHIAAISIQLQQFMLMLSQLTGYVDLSTTASAFHVPTVNQVVSPDMLDTRQDQTQSVPSDALITVGRLLINSRGSISETLPFHLKIHRWIILIVLLPRNSVCSVCP